MSYVSSIELRKVRPEAVHEKSVIESVVDLFHDVVDKVPQAYAITSRPPNPDQLESIEWIRFLSNAHEWHPSIRFDTLVLFIAYKNGLALWTIETNGIGHELFSIREHNICSACLIIYNSSLSTSQENAIQSQSPLFAIAKSAGPPSIQIRSLQNDQQATKILQLPGIGSQSEPVAIETNRFILICITHAFIIGYDLVKLEEKFFISTCFSSSPFSLSTRWLSFADYRLHAIHQSSGGINGAISEQNQSYTGAMLNVAKSFSKSVAKISESVLGYGYVNSSSTNNTSIIDEKTLPGLSSVTSINTTGNGHTTSPRNRLGSGKDEPQPGIVTVVDTVKLFGPTVHDEKQNWIIAHFQAHLEPVGHLQFNPSGNLLVTCDTSGHYFNVLELHVSPYRCTRTYIKHLYTLFRGDTDCRVSHMTFTNDSRWLAVSTKRGTTHLFAINPYGGAVNVRTHTKTYVVNKISRFQRSSGFDEQTSRPSNSLHHDHNTRDSSTLNTAMNHSNGHTNNATRTKRSTHECIFSPAISLIRQPTDGLVSGLSGPFNIDSQCIASIFGTSRGFLNPEDMVIHQEYAPKACSSLFIMGWHGRLIEYILEPIPDTIKYGTRITPETPIDLKVLPKAQWPLQRLTTWPEVRMSVGYAFLSQGYRQSSGNKTHSKEDWLRQVEMNTHAGPHRRLWMGPQFQFKHYSEATVSVCHPNSNVFTADLPQTSMNIVEADLQSLPIQWSKSNPFPVPDLHKDISPAYIEVGSGSFQDAPSLSLFGSSVDSLKSDFEVELMERLADAASDLPWKTGIGDTTDSLSSSTCSGTVTRPLPSNHSSDNIIPFPDTTDTADLLAKDL